MEGLVPEFALGVRGEDAVTGTGKRGREHQRLHHGKVVLADRLPGEKAHAVQGEDLLNHDRAAQHEAEPDRDMDGY